MAVSLSKEQKVDLTKNNAGLRNLIIGLGWDTAPPKKSLFGKPKAQNIDCDASALMLSGGRLLNNSDIVSFANLTHHTGAVTHMGDNLTGDGAGDDEQIKIELAKVPANYDKIVFAVNIFMARERKQHFGLIENAFIRIVNADNNQELCRYNLTENYGGMTAMIFGEVSRAGGEWNFTAVGQATDDPGIGELAKRFS